MKDEDALPTTTASTKKESSDSVMLGKGRYKFWALAAILLLAFWSMFTGTVSLRWSGTLNSLSNDLDIPIHDDLDVLEMEEREKVVRHMWDVYTNSRRIRLPRFWQEAFEAAYEELTSDDAAVRDAAITEIAKMSVRSIDFDPPPIQSAEISIAANVPQKEIGKYMKILGEALQLSQPINSNSISVHMPRFCTLLQLNKSAQELATHIGEVVINKCFCTRRNPISISAAAIYLACQLEDKRKTQAEICKVTGLTEVTLRKVYKELLENWDDLLPSNYTPAVPPERAFPMTVIASGRSTTAKVDAIETTLDTEKLPEIKPNKPTEVSVTVPQSRGKDEAEVKSNTCAANHPTQNQQSTYWQSQLPSGTNSHPNVLQGMDIDRSESNHPHTEKMAEDTNGTASANSLNPSQLYSPPGSSASSVMRQFSASPSSGHVSVRLAQSPKTMPGYPEN
ncbi:hypothetical protein Ahy_Scaffold1g106785 isoform A [Arachis hypogaea]|uniref:Cyclin-like domain-containing protein n=1 Tax=Arachis hypogaea TaxID=3818 RepID=A0A444WS83_ARAHY|nr:hypothetical protein Ahy_Scaffold1g106785 isoform A [Arachis hypogaea]